MSAQCYTNKRRILAEASLRKTHYPGSIGLNNNPIYASINCNPDFTKLTYLINTCCIKKIKVLPTEQPQLIVSGGGANSTPTATVSGGGANTIATETVSGGGASGGAYVEIPPVLAGKASGGGANTIATETVSGGGANTIATETASGGNASST